MISIRNVVFIVNTVLLCVLIVFNVYFVNGETSFVDTKEYEYGSDIFFEITHPPELQYTYRIRPAKSFGIPFDKERFPSKKTKLVLVDPTHGCEMPTNAKQLKGNVAFVKRGRCSFLKKTIISELSGAKAIVITDNNIYDDTAYVHMIDDNSEMSANIPAGFLVGKSGHLIHSKMSELMVTELPIVFPLNMTYVPLHKINQPPWISI
ncbi:PRADC1-like protein isoform X2 [Sipha flava]|uniref:PRADC1-like protein isoform X2 n=1 Tax=Sipha flava TaxID=143950 RepID=A0A8B8G213_9HEMI|nr:PRADC1-like protein isoform X2 [Sipha flava]